MAKELPYFKFEPAQWENGNIQMCTHEQQGIFICICSMYWQRLGELSYALALRKLCGGNESALKSLIEADVIKLIDGHLCIDFLNEQLEEFENTSNKNRENARIGWEKRKNNATALRPHSERNAIREEKRRREDINTGVILKPFNPDDFYQSGAQAFESIKNDEVMVEGLLRIVHNNGFKSVTPVQLILAVKNFITVESLKSDFKVRHRDEIKKHLTNWVNKNGESISKQYARV